MDNIKEYPMDKDEFYRRVIELFIEKNTDVNEEKIMDFMNNLLENDDYFDILYADSCYREDRWGEAFTDEELIHQPVRLLEMIFDW